MNSVMQLGSEIAQRLSMDFNFTDANNNSGEENKVPRTRGEKYSLRPRSLRKGDDGEEETAVEALVKRVRGGNKQKQRAAPLSKYRRKTANARERSRMREINAAFEALRQCVPISAQPTHAPSASEKLTKITTLRLAMKYISALSAALKDNSQNVQTPEMMHSELHDLLSDCSDLDCLLLESDGESLPLSDHSLTTADFSPTSVDFGDSSFSPTFPDSSLSPFDTFFPDFS